MIIALINLQKKIAVSGKKIERIIKTVLRLEKVRKPGKITVCLMTDRRIRKLNNLYLGKHCSTDVISFDISRSDQELAADIAVSVDTAAKNAKIYRTSTLSEIYLYVIHGLLHLLGYDDGTQKKRKKMHDRQDSILTYLNI